MDELDFNEDEYLRWNLDVLHAVREGRCRSGSYHYKKYGSKEPFRILGVDTSAPVCCDAIMVVTDRFAATSSLESLQHQKDATVFIHLIDPSSIFRDDEFLNTPYVQIHRQAKGSDTLDWVHYCIPKCRTDTILFQQEGLRSSPNRARLSVNALTALGAEIYCGAVDTEDKVFYPNVPDIRKTTFEPTLLWAATAMRKNAYIDLGGVGNWETSNEKWHELICRALTEKRPIAVSGHEIVTGSYTPIEPPADGPGLKAYQSYRMFRGFAGLTDYGRTYQYRTPVAVDVVMSIHDNFEFATEAIDSILKQRHANVHLHLIDDASTERDGSEFLKQYADRPGIYTYFNRRGIGPYLTINNIYPYLRSDYLAIQDADDVSFPTRLYEAINSLEISRSDLFFSNSVGFGGSYTDMASYTPDPHTHATMVIRKSTFRMLGGYTDTGCPNWSTPLDLDLIERAKRQFRFFVSRRPFLFKRLHAYALSKTFEYSQEFRKERQLMHLRHNTPMPLSSFGGLGNQTDLTLPLNRQRISWMRY